MMQYRRYPLTLSFCEPVHCKTLTQLVTVTILEPPGMSYSQEAWTPWLLHQSWLSLFRLIFVFKPGNSFYIISPHCCIPKLYPSPALSCVVSESFMISLCNSRHRIRLWSKVMRTIQREALPGTVEVRDHKTHHADSKISFNTTI